MEMLSIQILAQAMLLTAWASCICLAVLGILARSVAQGAVQSESLPTPFLVLRLTKIVDRCFCGIWMAIVLQGVVVAEERELVHNPSFRSDGAEGLPSDWTLWSPPVEQACCNARTTTEGVVIDASNRPYAVGGIWQDLPTIESGQAYAVTVTAKASEIASPLQSVLVRLTWTGNGRPLHPAGMYVRGPRLAEGKLEFSDVLVAPKDADGARLSLELKWPRGGSVIWQSASVLPTATPAPRKVKVGTVYLLPNDSTPERNLELFCQQIDAAGKLGLDIVCLPEAITMPGTSLDGPQLAEPIPGPSTERLAAAAKQNRLWVVAGLYERDGGQVFNAAVLLDRQGRLVGKYRKVHLPRQEWQLGIAPGHEYPVFKTDFGTVAIQICYDWFFPEAAAAFALNGAEILFAPTWGETYADKDGCVYGENTFRVRARDNGLYMVPSIYDGSSMIVDPMGRILASNKSQSGVFWCEIDLNDREVAPDGYWRSLGPRDRMPSTYEPLLRAPVNR